MTVLSRSKNAAARVTRHDCKWTGSARQGRARRPHPFGSSTVSGRIWHCLPAPRWGRRRVRPPAPPALSARPLVVSADEELLDDLLRLLAAAGAEPELATGGPALRRAHRYAPLVLVGADALTGSGRARAAAPAGRGRRVRPASCRPPSGRRPSRWVPNGSRCCPADEAWLLRAGGRPPSGRRSSVAGWSPSAAAAGAPGRARSPRRVALAAAPGRAPGRRRPVGRRPRPAPGRRARGGPALAGPRPGCAGGWPGTRCWPRCPRSAACTSWPRRGQRPRPVPDEALVAVVEAARSVGCPVVVDLPRAGPAPTAARGARRRRSRRPRGARPAAGGHRRAAAGGGARVAVVVGPAGGAAGAGRPRPGTRSPMSSAGRCSPTCRTTAAPCRAGNEVSRPRSPARSPLGTVALGPPGAGRGRARAAVGAR